MSESAPESRTMTVGCSVSPTEKRAVDLVAAAEKKTVAELLRPTVQELVARGNALADLLRDMEPSTTAQA